jgi:hydroxymethylbilane synthase
VPIAAWATVNGGELLLRGMISDLDGLLLLYSELQGTMRVPESLGKQLAETLLRRGGEAILRDIYGKARFSGTGNYP